MRNLHLVYSSQRVVHQSAGNICPQCAGRGRVDGKICQACGGLGKLIENAGEN